MAGRRREGDVAMPADRLLHARLGHSAKVSSLSDLEYRVWTTYVLAADDFGLMRADAVAFQAAACVERLVKVALVAAFEHQGARYLYQADWQDFQRVRFPARTLHPLPASAEVSARTHSLWSVHPGGTRVAALPKHFGTTSAQLRKLFRSTAAALRQHFRRTSEVAPHCRCARMNRGRIHVRRTSARLPQNVRLTHARAKRLTAYGYRERGVRGERGRGGRRKRPGAAPPAGRGRRSGVRRMTRSSSGRSHERGVRTVRGDAGLGVGRGRGRRASAAVRLLDGGARDAALGAAGVPGRGVVELAEDTGQPARAGRRAAVRRPG